jgi:chorismate mutase
MHAPRPVRALRGAICVAADEPGAVAEATHALLAELCERNALAPDDVVSVLFATTADLASEWPARALRDVPGWEHVPLLCTAAMPVPHDLPRCLRVLVHAETALAREAIVHVYLRGAEALRTDLVPPRG